MQIEILCEGERFSTQISQCIQFGDGDSLHWPTDSCLVWKWRLCDLCYIHRYTIDNWHWTFCPQNFGNVTEILEISVKLLIMGIPTEMTGFHQQYFAKQTYSNCDQTFHLRLKKFPMLILLMLKLVTQILYTVDNRSCFFSEIMWAKKVNCLCHCM